MLEKQTQRLQNVDHTNIYRSCAVHKIYRKQIILLVIQAGDSQCIQNMK